MATKFSNCTLGQGNGACAPPKHKPALPIAFIFFFTIHTEFQLHDNCSPCILYWSIAKKIMKQCAKDHLTMIV